MSGLTYPVDYTGNASSNRVSNELQLISSANFRNYKVIIPDFAPFYGNSSFALVHQDSNTVLHEGTDFYFTHLFSEATKSIGIPVYGSVSVLNQNLSGTFVLTYQTVGGEWTLPGTKIAEILGRLVIGPRVARWEQVVGYPATFPPINHDHNEDDLTGMSDVVTALLAIQNAIDTAYANGLLNFASNNEAIQGILSAKIISPATLKYVTDSVKSILRDEIHAADNAQVAVVESFNRDMFGNSAFLNDGFNVYKEAGVWTLHTGTAYLNGKRVSQLSNQAMVGMSYPCDVWLDMYTNSNGVVQTDVSYKSVVAITNLLRFSEDFKAAHWTYDSNVTVTANAAYGSSGNKNISKIVFTAASVPITQTLPNEALSFGQSYLISGFGRTLTGNGRIAGNIGQVSANVGHQLPVTPNRFAWPVVAGDRKSVKIYIGNPGSLEIGEVQVEPSAVNYNLISNGNDLAQSSWTKTNVTITSAALAGPFPESALIDSVTVTAVNALHEISTPVSLIAGQIYSFSMQVKPGAVGYHRIIFANAGDTDAFEFSTATQVIVPDTVGSTGLVRSPTASIIYSDTSVDTTFVHVKCILIPKVTGIYTFTCRMNASAFLGGGGGAYLNGFMLVAKSFSPNLLLGSNDFGAPTWVPNALSITPDVAGAKLVPTITNNSGSIGSDSHVAKQLSYQLRPSQPYTFAAEFKASGASKVYITIKASADGVSFNQTLEYYADLVALTASAYVTPASGGWTSVSNNVISLGSGWYRVYISGTTSATIVAGEVALGVSNGITQGSHVFTGDGSSGVLVRKASFTLSSTVPTYSDSPDYPLNKYVPTNFQSRTDYDGAYWYPYVNDGIYHYPVKIATLPNSVTVVDRRKVLHNHDSILKDGQTNSMPIDTDSVLVPNVNSFIAYVGAGTTQYIPSTSTLSKGDTFRISQPLGGKYYLRVLDPTADALWFKNSVTGTVQSDVMILVDIDKLITVIYDGSALNVIY